MEGRRKIITWLLVALFVSYLSFANTQESESQDESKSFSASESASTNANLNDENPCSFRGKFILHEESIRLDPCTLCVCNNGTTTCEIESCPAEAGCSQEEIVVIAEECCPQCPYTMFVEDTHNQYAKVWEFTEGDTKAIKFSLDMAIHRKLTSRTVRGEDLWKLSAWVSPNLDGSGRKFSFQDNIFNEKEAAQEYSKPNYPPWGWDKLKYTMEFLGGTCDDYNYFCVEFGQADNPQTTYNLKFTFQAIDEEQDRLIDCVPLGECKGLTATDLDWEVTTTEDPIPGQQTSLTFNVGIGFTEESANKRGESLWRVGMFGSTNPSGDGVRFDEVRQTLNEEGASTTKKGATLNIGEIAANFDLGTIGCGDVQFLCVEFAQGDDPDPPFTLTIDSSRGDSSSDSLVKCKERECSARAIFSTLVPDLTGDFPAIENRVNTIRMNLDAITDKERSTSVAGTQLWELGTFFNARANGKGPRIQPQTQILNPFQQDGDLILNEDIEFAGIDFQADLTGNVCSDIPFICFELKKGPSASMNYVFGTNPTQDPFVECTDFSKYCRGVMYNGIVWDRTVPEHTPGEPVPLTISASIQVDPASRGLSGSGLYAMSVFVASDPEGANRQTPSFDQVLTASQMATALIQREPLVINNIQTPPLVVEQLGCAEFKFLCVEFRKGDSAEPDYTASFVQSDTEIGSADDGVIFTGNSLIQCHEEECPGTGLNQSRRILVKI